MNTKEIEEALKEQASKLKKGTQKQKVFGEQVHALALAIEKDRNANKKPFDTETREGTYSGGNDRRLPPARKWPGR
jgi:di/tripeptidase